MVISMKNKKSLSILVIVGLISIMIFSTNTVSACYYEIGTFESDYTTTKNTFFKGEIVYGRGNAYGYNYPLKLRINDPNCNTVYYSDESTSVVYGSFFLNETALVGTWSIQLGIYKSCKWQWSTDYGRIAYFTVTDANFTLTTDVVGNGSVFVDPELSYYPFGTLVNLNAIPDSGWSFSHWTGDLISTNNYETIIMNCNKSVNAHFIQNQYELNISVIGNGTIIKEPNQEFYVYGDIVNLTCFPGLGWIFDHWEGNISGNENPAFIMIDENKDVTAVFIESLYTLTVNIDGDGVVDVNPLGSYYFGDIVSLNAIANNGSVFKNWTGDIESTNSSETIIIDSNKTVTAHFIKSQEGGGGSSGGGGRVRTTVKPNKLPVANLSAGEPYIGFIDEEIDFDGSFSYDTDGKIVKYEWNFGDGTTGNGEITTHAYLLPGEYNVELKVTDNRGGSDTDKTIAVIIVPNHPPSKPVLIGPNQGEVNIAYSFSIFSTDEDQDKIKYIIDWGDGSITESDYILSGDLFNASHKWMKPGQYNIIIKADDGKIDTTEELTIIIKEPKPTISESNNFMLIILALIALLLFILFLLLAKKDEDEDKNQKKK